MVVLSISEIGGGKISRGVYIGVMWGRVDDFSFFECSSLFCSLNFIILFPLFIQYYHIMFIIIVFLSSVGVSRMDS